MEINRCVRYCVDGVKDTDPHGAVLRDDALHDGVLARDVHDLARWLFHAFAGPPPVERLAGRLRLEDSFQLVDLRFVLP